LTPDLQGITADGIIREAEVIGLKNWLEVHCHLKKYWPVCEAWDIAERILADGKVDENEKKELLEFCRGFCEIPVKAPILKDEIYKERFMKSGAPTLKPISAICDRNHQIIFKDRTFCFTGPAKFAKRSELEEMAISVGGIVRTGVSTLLDYLVIGAQSSPAWYFSTYGRKIEKAMNLKNEKGSEIVILYEDDFINQIKVTA
jgi:NAD-dependent DNA ligase